MKNLREHFRNLALMQIDLRDQERIFAALTAGAEATIDRLRSVGGSYVGSEDVAKVAAEIAGEPAPPAPEPLKILVPAYDDRSPEQIELDARESLLASI